MTQKSNEEQNGFLAKPVLAEGLIKHYVRWRHIPIDMMFTPLMHISIDHTVVEAKSDANDWDIALAVVQELPMLNIRPDDVRIESRQPLA
jgi:hypothetical protein